MCYKSVQILKSPEIRMFLKRTSRIIQGKYFEAAADEGRNSRVSPRILNLFPPPPPLGTGAFLHL